MSCVFPFATSIDQRFDDIGHWLDGAKNYLTEHHAELPVVPDPSLAALVLIGVVAGIAAWEVRKPDVLAYPYYVDTAGLRSLANSLKINLPIAREIKRRRRLGLSVRSFGGMGERAETQQLEGVIDLQRLSEKIEAKVRDKALCSLDLDAGSGDRLRDAAARSQLLIIRGRFGISGSPEAQPGEPMELAATDSSLRVVMPDPEALTRSGAERLARGQPFYGQVIAHSASHAGNRDAPVVASAYAVWGRTNPR